MRNGSIAMNPLVKFRINPKAEHTYGLGYNEIVIFAFNYDGSGNALVKLDDEYDYLSPEELRTVMMSHDGENNRCYIEIEQICNIRKIR